MTSAASAVFAEEISIDTRNPKIGELCENGLYFVGEKETVLEDGTVIIERSYTDTSPDEILLIAATTGSKRVNHVKEITQKKDFVVEQLFILSLEAVFYWNQDKNTVTVDQSTIKFNWELGDDAPITTAVLKEPKKEVEENQGFNLLWGRVYAYVRFTITARTDLPIYHEYSIYIDCNVDGVASRA